MSKHVAVPVPGIDLSFWPRTYFGPLPLDTHLLAHVAGYRRREIVRAALAWGEMELIPELRAVDPVMREAIGRIHPTFMGGEYLPPS